MAKIAMPPICTAAKNETVFLQNAWQIHSTASGAETLAQDSHTLRGNTARYAETQLHS